MGSTTASAIEPKVSLHRLSDDERRAAQKVLAAIDHHAATFLGTRRQGYDAMAAMTPMAEKVSFEEVRDPAFGGWWVRPENSQAEKAILFLHGGAYMLGSATAYRGFASQVAVRAGVAAFVLDYPLAPEHPFPAAFESVILVRRWLATQGVEEISLVGDSAGGGLALASLNTPLHDSPWVASVVVFSPWTDLTLSGSSVRSADTHDPIFEPATLAAAATTYLGAANPKDGRASPLFAIPDSLPPLAIQ